MKYLDKQKFFNILPKINLLLVLIVIVLVVNLCLNMLRPRQPFAFNERQVTDESELISQEVSGRLGNLPVFQEGIFRQRSLFSPLLEKKVEPQEARFTLLGIVSVGDKKAAMIRESRENKDYYCLGGETIGAFKVKQILLDRVILESEAETLEISR